MKKSISVLLSVILLLTLSFPALAKTQYLYPSSVINRSDFSVVAHRGLNSLAPENTLAAFELAGQYGFWGCEFDIYPTTDGYWAVMHDPTVDRMTNGSGAIMNMTFKELQKLRIDRGTNIKKYPDERIPELSQVLDICSKYGMHPVIEIKGGNAEEIKTLCSQLLKREDSNSFIFTSFSSETLKTVRSEMKKARIWLLAFGVSDFDIALCKAYGFECLDTNYALTTQSDVEKIRSNGLVSGVWTLDSAADMERFYSYGTRIATTNGVLPISKPQTTSPPVTSPQTTSPQTTSPQTTSPQGDLSQHLSQENKVMLKIVYSEAEKLVGLYRKMF